MTKSQPHLPGYTSREDLTAVLHNRTFTITFTFTAPAAGLHKEGGPDQRAPQPHLLAQLQLAVLLW